MNLEKFAHLEQQLKWLSFALGLLSTISIVQGWHLASMVIGLPFCLIWVYCGWLRTEPQLKYINLLFAGLYVYGIGRYLLFV